MRRLTKQIRRPDVDNLDTLRLLQASGATDDQRYFRLYHELTRIDRTRRRVARGALTLSVKLSPGRLEGNRYDSVVYTTAADAPGFYRAVVNGAPSEAVAQLLGQPSNYVARWIREAGRTVSYLAVAFETRLYKIYLLETAAASFLEGRNLVYLLPRLQRDAYIDCIEVDLDQPQNYRHPVYFNLRASDLKALFAPGYQPHPQIDNRLLKSLPDAQPIIAALGNLTAGLRRLKDPVIKLRYEPGDGSERDEVDRFCQADYSINVNTFDPSCLKYVDAYRAEILTLADVMGCQAQVTDWLEAIRSFDCVINYLSVGNDFVTIYYKSVGR